jgi:4-amino-4-deoxy-L-arabinose transferase-like glycosyltransferase
MKNLVEFRLSNSQKNWIFGIFLVLCFPYCLSHIGIEKRPPNGYDERMWTSTSIATYAMVKGHIRSTNKLDNWFAAYAWRYGLPIFKEEKITNFRPDTIRFPFDMVTLAEENGGNTFVAQYDTLAFPRERFQWFDHTLWTFGWKAPNLGKYIMGWFNSEDVSNSPEGYYRFEDENGNPSTAPFAYPPAESVYRARIPNAILAALSIGLIFWLGWVWLGFSTGLLASLILLFNEDFITVNTAAGLDSFVLFFSLLSLAGLSKQIPDLFKGSSYGKIVRLALFTGVALGCTVSSKLNGALFFYLAGISFAILGFYVYRAKQFSAYVKPVLFSGTITLLTGLGIFYVLNPIVRQQPVAMIKTMRESIDDYFEKRAKILMINRVEKRVTELATATENGVQTGILGPEVGQGIVRALSGQMQFLATEEQANRLPLKIDKSWREIIRQQEVLEKAGISELPKDKHFYNWVKIKNELPDAFALVWQRLFVRFPDAPNYYGTLGSRFPFDYNFGDLLLFFVGILALLKMISKRFKDFLTAFPLLLFLASTLIVGYGNTSFLWNDWSRYFTPMLPFMALAMGLGLTVSSAWILKRFAGKKQG